MKPLQSLPFVEQLCYFHFPKIALLMGLIFQSERNLAHFFLLGVVMEGKDWC